MGARTISFDGDGRVVDVEPESAPPANLTSPESDVLEQAGAILLRFGYEPSSKHLAHIAQRIRERSAFGDKS